MQCDFCKQPTPDKFLKPISGDLAIIGLGTADFVAHVCPDCTALAYRRAHDAEGMAREAIALTQRLLRWCLVYPQHTDSEREEILRLHEVALVWMRRWREEYSDDD